ncbi:CPBP family intramembrane glutamic endopeptidase [Paenibacillus sp. PastF-1]|uniref:CPBP family intramembrane glutamic endopeptidase n=1 Tax=Paenibacillus sp. PastF-1 TaxID=2940531 RepID=UPI0024056648|nr:CPBP family intramembrane glutamic endopeptidase [Paenibacillus sp. PastF-1]
MFKFSEDTLLICIGMECTLLTVRTAHLIKDRLFPGAVWLRRTVYFLPYLLFYFVYHPDSALKTNHALVWIIVSLLLGTLLLLLRKRELTTIYNREFITYFSPMDCKNACLESYSSLGSAILQELFFKGFILSLLLPVINPLLAVVLTGFFFTEEHILHYRAKNSFEIKDYLLQFLMSIISGLIYWQSASLFIGSISHIVFNLSLVVNYWYRVWIHHSIRGEMA